MIACSAMTARSMPREAKWPISASSLAASDSAVSVRIAVDVGHAPRKHTAAGKVPADRLRIHRDRFTVAKGVERHDVGPGIDRDAPFRVPAAVNAGKRPFRVDRIDQLLQVLHHVFPSDRNVGGASESGEDRLIDKAHRRCGKRLELPDLPPAFRGERRDDHVAKLFVVVDGSLVLVDNREGKTARTRRLNLDERKWRRAAQARKHGV